MQKISAVSTFFSVLIANQQMSSDNFSHKFVGNNWVWLQAIIIEDNK